MPGLYRPRVHTFRRELVLERLESKGWNIAATARELGIARQYLYVLMRKLGLRRGKAAAA